VAAIVVMELLPTGGLLLPSSTQPPVGSKERARGLPVPLIGQPFEPTIRRAVGRSAH
jgi:hypothetical protein